MDVHLIDGTYELFRHYYALPSARDKDGREVAAVRGVLNSVLTMINGGAKYMGVATDHVIESFRNDLWPGYKTSAGVPPELRAQFPLLEEVLIAAGICTWPMVELEADDALAAAARVAAADPAVDQVVICTPDKDLGQCVGGKVVQLDRRRGITTDADGVRAKFGVDPESIPDYLALVGDSADGFPGLKGWGAKSAGAVLARYKHLEQIPAAAANWDVKVANPGRLAATLQRDFELALLFRRIATLDADSEVLSSVEDLHWSGPRAELVDLSQEIDGLGLAERAVRLAERRAE